MKHHRVRQHPTKPAAGYLVEVENGGEWDLIGFVWPAHGRWSWATSDKRDGGTMVPTRHAAVDALIAQVEHAAANPHHAEVTP